MTPRRLDPRTIFLHWLIFLLFVTALNGVLFMQAGDKEVAFVGWVLPQLMASNPGLHSSLKEIHQWVGKTFFCWS